MSTAWKENAKHISSLGGLQPLSTSIRWPSALSKTQKLSQHVYFTAVHQRSFQLLQEQRALEWVSFRNMRAVSKVPYQEGTGESLFKISIELQTVKTGRLETKKYGGGTRKYSDNIVSKMKETVDKRPTDTVRQLPDVIQQHFSGFEINKLSVNRILDGHGYTVKPLMPQPLDRNLPGVEETKKEYVTWLQDEGLQKLHYYVADTNYNISCSISYSSSFRETKAVQQRVSSKRANVNITAVCQLVDSFAGTFLTRHCGRLSMNSSRNMHNGCLLE